MQIHKYKYKIHKYKWANSEQLLHQQAHTSKKAGVQRNWIFRKKELAENAKSMKFALLYCPVELTLPFHPNYEQLLLEYCKDI